MADQSVAVRIEGLNDMVNDLRKFGQKEVAKEIGKVNRKFAMDVRDKVRQKIKQQPVPFATKSARGVTHLASGTKASIKMTRDYNKTPTLFMANFGAKYQSVPNSPNQQMKWGIDNWGIRQTTIGKLPDSRSNAKRTAKDHVANIQDVIDDLDWGTNTYKDYALRRTIVKEKRHLEQTYADEVHKAMNKFIKDKY